MFYKQEELVPLNDLLADETCDELEEEDETSGENISTVGLVFISFIYSFNQSGSGEAILTCHLFCRFELWCKESVVITYIY